MEVVGRLTAHADVAIVAGDVRVVLGDCFRAPTAPPASTKTRASAARLLLDPGQQPLLDDIEANARLRLTEATEKGWLGKTAAFLETRLHVGRNEPNSPHGGRRRQDSRTKAYGSLSSRVAT
jgi:hypothetical protein